LYKTNTKWKKAVVFMVGAFLLIFILAVFIRQEEITQRLIRTIQEGDLAERDIVWSSVLPVWLDNPIFGIGTTGYEYFTYSTAGRYISPHNVILEVLCLTGIVGLIFYLIFLIRIIGISYQTYIHNKLLLPVLLLVPVFGLLMSAQLLDVKIGWVIFAYIVANSIYLSKSENVQTDIST
jgi:O-antigen ligase